MNQPLPFIFPNNVKLTIKREDLLHPQISGNKFRKLKYNIIEAKAQNKKLLVTFGGAFSNHIAATAAAGKEYGFKTVGIIRGNELKDKISENPTLNFAQQSGMQLIFISREEYRDKNNPVFISALENELSDFYLVPEGGTNFLAIKGCEEILDENDIQFTHICCSAGTGGTLSGLINSSFPHQKVIGFPALKGSFLSDDIRSFVNNDRWELVENYHFGGYAKINSDLVEFMNDFFERTNILLDPVYTGKMVFGVIDLIEKNYFRKNSDILLVHTGGLQGIEGMNLKLKHKNLPIIKTGL